MLGSLPDEYPPAEQVFVALVSENMHESITSISRDRTGNFIFVLKIQNMKLRVNITKLIKI